MENELDEKDVSLMLVLQLYVLTTLRRKIKYRRNISKEHRFLCKRRRNLFCNLPQREHGYGLKLQEILYCSHPEKT